PHYLAHGINVAAQMVGLRSQVMLEKYQIPREAVEALVLADYFHARNNPRARAYKNEVDAAAYRASRLVVDPYRLHDCSRESDGAAAVIVMSAEAARKRSRNPVYLLGIAQGAPYRGGDAVENFGEYGLSGFSSVAKRLWQQTGLGPADVDVVQVYENFSPPASGR
ncbi:transporter, partial [Mycobacterium avium subsp. hominissuis 10-5606]